MGDRDPKGRNPLRVRGQRRRLPCAGSRPVVRALRAHGRHVTPVRADRAGRRAGSLDGRKRPQAAVAARRRQLLLPASGKDRLQHRSLRAQLQSPLDHPRRPDARRFLLPAVGGRSRPDRVVRHRCHGAGATGRHFGRIQDPQRPHPLHPRRPAADRPDAGRAQRLRSLRLHLRHHPGRRCRQGARRVDYRRRDRVGHVVL